LENKFSYLVHIVYYVTLLGLAAKRHSDKVKRYCTSLRAFGTSTLYYLDKWPSYEPDICKRITWETCSEPGIFTMFSLFAP